MAHSTSSALPPALIAALATASSRASCRAGPATLSGSTARSRGSSRAPASRSRAAPGPLARGLGQQPEGPAQAAQAEGVGAAERAAEQLGRHRLVEHGRAQGAAQQQQQRPGARLVAQRQLVAGHGDRDPGRGQRAAQQRHLPGRGPDQDRHRGPGHAVGQVSAAQRVRDQGRLLGRAVRDQDADLARRGVPGGQVPVPDLAARAAAGPPGARRPAGRGRCGGRCPARSPARAARPRCGTARGTR